MKLFEIFKTAETSISASKFPGADIFQFSLNGVDYIIQFLHMTASHPLYGMMKRKPSLTDNSYFFAFAASVNGEMTDKDIDMGDSIVVFSHVIQLLVKYVHEHNVDQLILGCDANHEKRKRIYQKIVSKYTRSYGWFEEFTTITNYMGPKYTWVLART